MPKSASPVTASEISRLAGVTRATVSNWRRRHTDFPSPIGGTESRPVFDLHQVQEWLSAHGVEAPQSPLIELRTYLRSQAEPSDIAQLMESLQWTGERWESRPSASPGGPVLKVLQRAADIEGSRAALDVLAERGLEDVAATGVYQTPGPLAALMAELAEPPVPQQLHSALDPACGSGSLLLAAARGGATQLYGQDTLPVQVQRTRLNLESATLEPTVRVGDTMSDDAFPGLEVDAVLCNPPYSDREWGADELALDPRWQYGVPPRGESELAWVQHALAHLKPGGRAVLLLPPAVASRPSGRRIRAALLRSGALRAVIGFAPGIAQPWHVGLQLWVLRRPENVEPAPDTMLFIDASAASGGSGDGTDWEALRRAVLDSWRAFDGGSSDAATMPGVATAVRVMEVLDESVDVTPARYVRSSFDPALLSTEVEAAIRDLAGHVATLAAMIDDFGAWRQSDGKPWRTATVADLAGGGALQWFRASPPRPKNEDPADDHRRVLTAMDVVSGHSPSGTFATSEPAEAVIVTVGDVLIPAVRSDASGARSARVAGPEDAEAVLGPHVYLLRPNAQRLDSWFVAGFINSAENASTTRTSTIRFDPSRLRIPLLPLHEQRRYGAAFQRLYEIRSSARRLGDASEHAIGLVASGLTAGALEPASNTTRPDNVETTKQKIPGGNK
ncbi:N-6 DNA methylase [Nocardia cerradoensis]|nr:N-6 DNA methylase [Nocardia cerradoensis]